MERVVTPFGAAVTLVTSSAVKVDISGLILSKNEKNKMRSGCYLYFRGVVNSALKSPDMAERQAATLLVSTLKLHGWRMQALPPDKFSNKLKAIITAFLAPDLKAAIATIGADKALAKLVAAHQQYEAADKLCVDARAAHSEVSPTVAMKRVYDEYGRLITAIEGLILTSDDPQVKDLVARLNVLTEAKRQTIKAKATRAENAKKEAMANGTSTKASKKSERKSVKKLSVDKQPLEKTSVEQLVDQQFVVDQPALAPTVTELSVEDKTVDDTNDVK